MRSWQCALGILLTASFVPLSSQAVTREEVLDWVASPKIEAAWEDGTVLERDALSAALRAHLPPGLFEELGFPGAQLEIQKTGDFPPHPLYREATLQYGPQTSLGPEGELQDYVAGLPFSIERIEAAPPEQGGIMVAWDNVHRWQYFGYKARDVLMNFVQGSDGEPRPPVEGLGLQGNGFLERVLHTNYQRVYLDHIAVLSDQGYRLHNADGDGLFYKDFQEFTEPFDVRGMKFVIERSDSARIEDQVFSYLPTQRRVRRVSAKERADSFMGSNLTMDDFEGFSGRVLDYRWVYLGRKPILEVADSKHEYAHYYGPNSRAPDDAWQLRSCLVVEQIPHWKDHPYGSKLLFVDEQTFNIPLALVFDHDGKLWKIMYTIYNWQGDEGTAPQNTVPFWHSMDIVDLKLNNATIVISQGTTLPEMSSEAVRRLFSVSNLTGGH